MSKIITNKPLTADEIIVSLSEHITDDEGKFLLNTLSLLVTSNPSIILDKIVGMIRNDCELQDLIETLRFLSNAMISFGDNVKTEGIEMIVIQLENGLTDSAIENIGILHNSVGDNPKHCCSRRSRCSDNECSTIMLPKSHSKDWYKCTSCGKGRMLCKASPVATSQRCGHHSGYNSSLKLRNTNLGKYAGSLSLAGKNYYEAYIRSLDDVNQHRLGDEIALIDARISELIEKPEFDSSSYIEEMGEIIKKLGGVFAAGDEKKIIRSIDELVTMHNVLQQNEINWKKVYEAINQRRLLVQTDITNISSEQKFITLERFMTFVEALTDGIREISVMTLGQEESRAFLQVYLTYVKGIISGKGVGESIMSAKKSIPSSTMYGNIEGDLE